MRGILLGAGMAVAGVAGCSLDDRANQPSRCLVGPTCVEPGTRDGASSVPHEPDAAVPTGGAAVILNAACGAGTCVPDDDQACTQFSEGRAEDDSEPVAPPPATDASAGVSPVPADAAAGLSATDAGAVDAGANDAASGDPVGNDAGWLPPIVDENRPGACHVRVNQGVVTRACAAGGFGQAGMPCTSSRDCMPATGCVSSKTGGQCLPFCCRGEDTCEAGRYCAERPLKAEALSSAEAPLVPVCVRGDGCGLDEPFPCPEGESESCTCPSETACTVVRKDGTTACLPPGDGKAGEACPCAQGFFCSKATETCVKICQLGQGDCTAGKCQTNQAFPEGWGVCVGAREQ